MSRRIVMAVLWVVLVAAACTWPQPSVKERERNACVIRLLAKQRLHDFEAARWVCQTERRRWYFDSFEEFSDEAQ